MRLTPENKEKQRQKILEGAAEVLRRDGYDGVNLDKVMAAAGLTRGAFYAHFRSKSDLLADVAAHQHPLRVILARRDGQTAAVLLAQMREVFTEYLSPDNLENVFCGCTVAALVGDIARGDDTVRAGFGAGWDAILHEMARGVPNAQLADLRAALVLATGAVTTAQACADAEQRAQVLHAALSGVGMLLDRAVGAR